jgi:integrase
VTVGVYRDRSVFWISYTPYKGAKQVRQSTGLSVDQPGAEREAEAILAKIKTDIRMGKWFPDRSEDITVGALGELWFSREETKKKKSLADDQSRWERLEDRLGRDTVVTQLGPDHVRRLGSYLSGDLELAAATVNRHMALLRSSLRYARSQGKRVPESLLLCIRTPTEHNERERVCPEEEYRLLLTVDHAELRLAIIIGYWSGMRLGEIVKLEWDQIDLDEGFVWLGREDTKTGEGRVVPLASEVVAALKAWPRKEGRVFVCTRNRISQAFWYHAKRLGISGLVFHGLRHTALSNLSDAGVDVMQLKAISGHRTMVMLARYVHPGMEKLKQAMKLSEQRSKLGFSRHGTDGKPADTSSAPSES